MNEQKTQDRQARIIAASIFVTLFFLWGGGYNTAPLFVAALLKGFNWSHAEVSWVPSTLVISLGVTGPLAGWLLDRIEARIVMGCGATLALLGLVLVSRANTFSTVLIGNLLLGMGLGASAWLPASVVVANWFGERRGTVMGLATAGMEFGGMAMTLLVGYVISQSGWRMAYLTVAVPLLIVVLPLLLVVVRTRPQGVRNQTVAESAQNLPGYEVSDALRTRSFWMLVVVQLTWGLAAAGMYAHLVSYLTGIGNRLEFATIVVGIQLGLGAIGKPTMGALADWIGGKNALAISLSLLALAILALLGARHEWLIGAYLLLTIPAATPAALVPLVAAETLGLKRFGTLYGGLQAFFTIGAFFGPLAIGKIYDLTHSYTLGYEIAAIAAVAGAAASFFCVASRPVPKSAVLESGSALTA